MANIPPHKQSYIDRELRSLPRGYRLAVRQEYGVSARTRPEDMRWATQALAPGAEPDADGGWEVYGPQGSLFAVEGE